MIDAAFAPAAAAVADGRIPGATLGMVAADGRRWVRHAGKAALLPEPEDLTEDHWFDLASVSKVIATTTMILRLADEGKLDLDAPLTTAIPDLRQYDVVNAAERQLTFRDCLAHRSFLPAVEPIYTYGDDPARLRAFVLQREWRHGPPVYSDINFILLGIAIERITGQPLGAWPLGEGLSFGPPPAPPSPPSTACGAAACSRAKCMTRTASRWGADRPCRTVRHRRRRARFRPRASGRQRREPRDARGDPYPPI